MKITVKDQEAAYEYAPDPPEPTEIGNKMRISARHGFIAGLLHERAKYVKLVEAAKVAAKHLRSYNTAVDWHDDDDLALGGLDKALKELEGE